MEDAITEESESETEDSGADALPDIQADTEADVRNGISKFTISAEKIFRQLESGIYERIRM